MTKPPLYDPLKAAKLPLWAQSALKTLARKVVEQEALIEELKGANPDTNVTHSPHYQDDFPLPKDTSVRFHVGDRKSDYIEVSHQRSTGDDERWLEVRSGFGVLAIRPSSSNVIKLRIEDF